MSFYLYHKCIEENGEFTVKLKDPMTIPPGSKWKVAVLRFEGSSNWTADEIVILCSDIVCNSYMNGKSVTLISNFQTEYGWYNINFITTIFNAIFF